MVEVAAAEKEAAQTGERHGQERLHSPLTIPAFPDRAMAQWSPEAVRAALTP